MKILTGSKSWFSKYPDFVPSDTDYLEIIDIVVLKKESRLMEMAVEIMPKSSDLFLYIPMSSNWGIRQIKSSISNLIDSWM